MSIDSKTRTKIIVLAVLEETTASISGGLVIHAFRLNKSQKLNLIKQNAALGEGV